MAWSASVISKSMDAGVVYVTIEYGDGAKTLRETYRSSNPDAKWVPDTVRSRLAQLETASSFSVDTGPITPPAPPAVDPNIALFRSRCRALETVKLLIDMGAIQADNAKVVALVNWIKNNAAYVDYL